MKRGPILTLLVVVVLAAGLLALNISRSSNNSAEVSAPSPPAAQATSAPAAPPPAAAAPPANAGENQPAPAAVPADAKYTGRTKDGSAAIAVTVKDNQVSAYLCDGKSVESWYQGSVSNSSIDAKGKGTNALTGSLSGDNLTGTVSANGHTWQYSAAPVNAPAGLYRAKDGSRTTGWIKDSTGQVTGLANNGGKVEPAQPLDTTTAQYVSGGDVVVSR